MVVLVGFMITNSIVATPTVNATINNFIGWETGGLEEADGTEIGSAVSVNTSNPTAQFGTFRLQIDSGIGNFISWKLIQQGTTDQGNSYIYGFYFQTNNINPTTNYILVDIEDTSGGGGIDIALNLEINGNLTLRNTTNNIIGTATNPFVNDTWFLIELFFQRSNSGNASVFIDGVEVINVINQDFQESDIDTVDEVTLGSSTLIGGAEKVFIDGFYFLSGANSSTERLGDFEVVGPYQNTIEDATDIGDTLDSGTWSNVGETPVNDTNTARYSVTAAKTGGTTTDEGNRSGPNNDARIDTIEAGKYIYKLRRGSGSGTDHFIRFGNSVDNMTDVEVSLITSFQIFQRVSQNFSIIPNETEFFQHGIRKDSGGKDLIASEIWAFVLQKKVVEVEVNVSTTQTVSDIGIGDAGNVSVTPISQGVSIEVV